MINSACPHALHRQIQAARSQWSPICSSLFLWVIMINCGCSPDVHLSIKVLTTALTAPAHPVSFPEVSWPSLMELQRHVDAHGPRLSEMTALVTNGPRSAVLLCSSSHRLYILPRCITACPAGDRGSKWNGLLRGRPHSGSIELPGESLWKELEDGGELRGSGRVRNMKVVRRSCCYVCVSAGRREGGNYYSLKAWCGEEQGQETSKPWRNRERAEVYRWTYQLVFSVDC